MSRNAVAACRAFIKSSQHEIVSSAGRAEVGYVSAKLFANIRVRIFVNEVEPCLIDSVERHVQTVIRVDAYPFQREPSRRLERIGQKIGRQRQI